MGSHYKAKCDQCRCRGLLHDVLRSYEFADGSTLTVLQGIAWCSRCQAITWSEVIPSLTDVEERIGQFESRDQEAIDSLLPFVSSTSSLDYTISRRLEELRRRANWLNNRKSPPHCLVCGTADVLPMSVGKTRSGNPKWTLSPHPNCGGTLTVLTQPVLSLNRLWIRYTPEGLNLASYEMSPSKGAVRIA